MDKLFTFIPFTAAIGILVIAFGAKADSENPIFGNDINASFVAELAASATADPDSTRPVAETAHRPESTKDDRESSDILQLPDIIVRPDSVDQEAATDSEGKALAKEEISLSLATLPGVHRGNSS